MAEVLRRRTAPSASCAASGTQSASLPACRRSSRRAAGNRAAPAHPPDAASAVAERRDELLEHLDLGRIGSSCTRYSVGTPCFSRCAATVSLASSMNSSISRCATLRSDGDDRLDQAGLVEHDLRLLEVEIDRSAAPAPRVENREQLVHPLEHRHERPVPLDRRRDRGPSGSR